MEYVPDSDDTISSSIGIRRTKTLVEQLDS